MNDLKQMAAMTALNHMMASSSFNICAVESVGRMLNGTSPAGETYDLLRTLHCISWSKMPTELRDSIPDLIKQCLGVEPAFQFGLQDMPVPAPAEKRPGLFQTLGFKS